MRWANAVARSAMLAAVSAGLAALLMLLVGSLTFAVRVRMGRADLLNGFEPNLFMRTVGLPVCAGVLLIVFSVSLWKLSRQRLTSSVGSSGRPER